MSPHIECWTCGRWVDPGKHFHNGKRIEPLSGATPREQRSGLPLCAGGDPETSPCGNSCPCGKDPE